MEITHKVQEEVDIKFPCLMELVDAGPDKVTLTGLVVLMVEPGKGVVVVTTKKYSDEGYGKGQWRTNWLKRTKPIGLHQSYWAPWAGTVTLGND